MHTANRRFIILLTTIIIAMTSWCDVVTAAQKDQRVSDSLYREVARLFGTEHRDSFYAMTRAYRAYHHKVGDTYQYYLGWQHEIFYDINANNFYQALRKTIIMADEIKKRKDNDYLYEASYLFGIIYSLQGNMEMARVCFQRALDESESQLPIRRIHIYEDLANTEMDTDAEAALAHIDMALKITKDADNWANYNNALAIKIIIAFVQKDWAHVRKLYKEYDQILKTHGDKCSTVYHPYVMMARMAADERYDEAIKWTDSLSGLDKYKFTAIIYELAGDLHKALDTQKRYVHLRDSTNSTIMMQELNDATNDVEMHAMRNKANEERLKNKVMLMVVIGAMAVIFFLIVVIYNRKENLKTLKRKNNELEILRIKSEEAERLKSNILQNMSHEIRTPLNIISGFTQLICQPGFNPSDEEKADILNRITSSSDNLVKILNSLLYVAAKESESYAAQRDEVNVNNLCRMVYDEYRQTIPDNISMSFDTELPDDFCITSSHKGIETILENLLNNARKFTAEGSIKLKCIFDKQKSNIIISVEDTGQEIQKVHQKRIFDIFYKVDNSVEGIGVGLPMSRHIARQLSGDLTLDTTYQNGARFVVTLPTK